MITKTTATQGQGSSRPRHHPSPVSGVDPAGALVYVVDVVDFAIKVSGFLPAFRKWQLGAGHVSRVSTYRTLVCAESYRREARISHHHHLHHQQEQHQVPKTSTDAPPIGLGHRLVNDSIISQWSKKRLRQLRVGGIVPLGYTWEPNNADVNVEMCPESRRVYPVWLLDDNKAVFQLFRSAERTWRRPCANFSSRVWLSTVHGVGTALPLQLRRSSTAKSGAAPIRQIAGKKRRGRSQRGSLSSSRPRRFQKSTETPQTGLPASLTCP